MCANLYTENIYLNFIPVFFSAALRCSCCFRKSVSRSGAGLVKKPLHESTMAVASTTVPSDFARGSTAVAIRRFHYFFYYYYFLLLFFPPSAAARQPHLYRALMCTADLSPRHLLLRDAQRESVMREKKRGCRKKYTCPVCVCVRPMYK